MICSLHIEKLGAFLSVYYDSSSFFFVLVFTQVSKMFCSPTCEQSM